MINYKVVLNTIKSVRVLKGTLSVSIAYNPTAFVGECESVRFDINNIDITVRGLADGVQVLIDHSRIHFYENSVEVIGTGNNMEVNEYSARVDVGDTYVSLSYYGEDKTIHVAVPE